MRHYEIVVLVHPDQSEQVAAMLRGFTALKQRMRTQQEPLPVQAHHAALP